MNHKLRQKPNSLLATILTLISLLPLTGVGILPAQRNSATPSRLQTVDPMPTYAITYTATGKGFSDVTDAWGTRTVKNRKITMAGSGIWRTYASGGWDFFPYDLTVTDDYDQVDTTPCIGQGGTDRHHQTWNITDPSRYAGGPVHDFPLIQSPLQRPDGSWYMLDPFSGFYVNRNFSYQFDNDDIWCGGDTGSGTLTWETGYYAGLMQPGNLEGDIQGKVFTTNTQFVSVMTDPPLTGQWNVTVRV